MKHPIYHKKKAFTLVELIVVMVILIILALAIIPIMNSIFETANQATDNANARLIYNASAMWFSENNMADDNLDPADLQRYMGLDFFPPAQSSAFGGLFSASVTLNGQITISTTKPATYDPSSGKLNH